MSSARLPVTPYRGTRDFLPAEMDVRAQVFGTLHGVIETYGYSRYDGPILESADIYEAKSGREIADLQLYSLTDRGGRRLALRPEMTPSVARMIAANANTIRFPARWYCNVNCHRYERPQRGRVREHWQINVDIFGSDSSNAEVEIFELIHSMLGSLGATRDMYLIRVNDRILLEGILTELVGVPAEQVRGVSAVIDRWAKYPREKLIEDAAAVGVSQPQFARLEQVLTAGPAVLDELSAGVRERSRLVPVLAALGDRITYDPLVVRAFEYYTSTVFEVFDTDPQNNRSLFGGGRYDDLVGLFSSASIPGIGFGMGDVTLFDFLETHGLLPQPRSGAEAVVLPLGPELYGAGRQVAAVLRGAGIRTVVPLESQKLGKGIGAAAKSGARMVVIVGPDDWSKGTVVLRDLASGEQQTVAVDDVGKVAGGI